MGVAFGTVAFRTDGNFSTHQDARPEMLLPVPVLRASRSSAPACPRTECCLSRLTCPRREILLPVPILLGVFEDRQDTSVQHGIRVQDRHKVLRPPTKAACPRLPSSITARPTKAACPQLHLDSITVLGPRLPSSITAGPDKSCPSSITGLAGARAQPAASGCGSFKFSTPAPSSATGSTAGSVAAAASSATSGSRSSRS
jgi:hypothetical protein